MRKFLSILFALELVGVAHAELSVEWIDGNTIRVSGAGYTVVTNTVYTNSLGTCTNCVQISPEQLREYKFDISSSCDDVSFRLDNIETSLINIIDSCTENKDDISSFQRFGNSPVGGVTFGSPDYLSYSNYVYTVQNSQTALDLSHIPSNFGSSSATRNAAAARWVGYNNGIYDYANTYVLPELQSTIDTASASLHDVSFTRSSLQTIRNVVNSMSEEPCSCQGDGAGTCPDGGASSGDCPCADQLAAIKDYVEHIDDDFHVQLQNMADVTNFIPRMDSYARLVSGILYQDGTIVVDDGVNSWSNVYNRGESDLYLYDKSNILQRIELLLYGLVSSNMSTNWGSASSDVSDDVSDVQNTIDDVLDSVSDANTEYSYEVRMIRGKITALFDALNFFGPGSLGNFSYGEPMQFDVYDFQFDYTHAADLRPLQEVCRTAMQIFYWTVGVVFMLVFWYRVIKFTTNSALRIIHFFNNLLT